ncbi:hypothetical protein RhiirC2_784892 [Rhizophagus irregularis]|uniref:Uncharacterized protein n=1 Tax=Rhizophagus irregularis TaxID=588596 RepID=A0A2N1MXQ8_9GLOM|nr:hypothetical protein RhiirC2_784892 [Rhizophagus irregularis]
MSIRNDFEVVIEKNKSISKLKEAINWLSRLEKAPVFDNFPQTNSSYENRAARVNRPSSREQESPVELAITQQVCLWYVFFPGSWSKTVTKCHGQATVRKKILIDLFFYVREFVILRRTKSFKWTVNIEHVALEGFKDSILKNKQPVLEYDGAVLNMLKIGQSNQDLLCRMAIVLHHNGPSLRAYASAKASQDPPPRVTVREYFLQNDCCSRFKYTVFIETPSKPFKEWTFSNYVSSIVLATIRILVLTRGCVDIKNENYKEALCKLLGELKTRTATTLINVSHEATKESIHYLASATFPFKNQ